MSRVELTDGQRELRDAFVEVRGYWSDSMQSLLELDPDFFATYLNLSAVPWRTGRLEPKVKELIYIAVDGAATHLYEPGFRQHVRLALELGATKEELLEVLQLTSTLGIHACTVGVPLLQEELAAIGPSEPKPLSERQERLRSDFTEKRGYWHPFWDDLLALDTPFLTDFVAAQDDPDAVAAAIRGQHPLGRWGTAEEIAETIGFLASDRASFITGAVLAADGGFTAA